MTFYAFPLVPKLQLGNAVREALASRDWKLRLHGCRTQGAVAESIQNRIPKQELGNQKSNYLTEKTTWPLLH